MHIISDDAEISQNNLRKLISKSHTDKSKGLNFFYEFLKLETPDLRKSDELAKSLVCDDWEFDARFCSLISKVFGKKCCD